MDISDLIFKLVSCGWLKSNLKYLMFFSCLGNAIGQDDLSRNKSKAFFSVGTIVNSSFSNIYKYEMPDGIFVAGYEKKVTLSERLDKSLCYGLSTGFGLSFESSKLFNQLLWVNYEMSNSSFNFQSVESQFTKSGTGNWTVNEDYRVNRSLHLVGLNYGISFKIYKPVLLDILINANGAVRSIDDLSGYKINVRSGPNFIDDSVYYSNTIIKKYDDLLVSLRLGLSADIKISRVPFAVFSYFHYGSYSVLKKNDWLNKPWLILGIRKHINRR